MLTSLSDLVQFNALLIGPIHKLRRKLGVVNTVPFLHDVVMHNVMAPNQLDISKLSSNSKDS